ncbi:MAG: HAD family hydrolase [Candidatus Helarchaeota archaeon]
MILNDIIHNNGIKGFIFDLDGTLINTLEHHVKAFLKAFSENGYIIDKEIIRQNMGRTPWDIPRDILFHKPPNDLSPQEKKIVDKIASAKMNYYNKMSEKNIPLQKGVIQLLNFLKKNNFKLAVCSSTPMKNVHSILKKTDLLEYFDQIITGDEVKIGKPDPEAYLLAARRLNLKVEECILVGDSVHDIEAGKLAGILTIAVCTGYHTKDQLISKNPNFIFNNLIELLDELDSY